VFIVPVTEAVNVSDWPPATVVAFGEIETEIPPEVDGGFEDEPALLFVPVPFPAAPFVFAKGVVLWLVGPLQAVKRPMDDSKATTKRPLRFSCPRTSLSRPASRTTSFCGVVFEKPGFRKAEDFCQNVAEWTTDQGAKKRTACERA
jgi:hypothetical protein